MKKMIIVLSMIFTIILSASNLEDITFHGISLSEMIEMANQAKELEKRNRDLVPVEVLYQVWEDENWVNFLLQIHSYDTNGFLSDVLYQSWNGSEWIDYMHMENTNNEFGWPTEIVMSFWDSINNVWMEAAIITNSYNALNQPTYSLIQANIAGVWMNSSQMTWTWSGDLMMEVLTEEWDFENGTGWLNDEWELFTYPLFLQKNIFLFLRKFIKPF